MFSVGKQQGKAPNLALHRLENPVGLKEAMLSICIVPSLKRKEAMLGYEMNLCLQKDMPPSEGDVRDPKDWEQ